jgi:hypothetical protein
MGINYLVAPFDSQMAEWAAKCNVPIREKISNGRRATILELKQAAVGIPGHKCQISDDQNEFQIRLESEQTKTFPCEGIFKNTIAPGVAIAPATYTVINGATRPNGEVEWMSFHGDMELIVAVVRELTTHCGPQVYFADCDGIPWIIASPDAAPIGPQSP